MSTTTVETMVLNMGPQHPSTHGVLRVILELDGETVVDAEPVIGYLHTGIEKTAEYRTWHQAIVLVDRMDYVASVTNNLGYVLAVEKLLGLNVPPRAQYIRVMMAELQRIASHLVWLGTHALDMGAVAPFWYGFQGREQILDLLELISGARFHTSFLRVGGVARDLPEGFPEKLHAFLHDFPAWLDTYLGLLDQNPIWLERLRHIGMVSAQDAIDWGLGGPSLRGSGVNWDLRKAAPYSSYDHFDFRVPVGKNGDVYDRYRVRMEEMAQSLQIVRQAFDGLPEGPVKVEDPHYSLPPRPLLDRSMESLIHHFKLASEAFSVPAGETYTAIEGPRGELGFYLVSDGGNRPYRMRVRPPCFYNLQALPAMVRGHLVADVVACIGSIDIILGEVDR